MVSESPRNERRNVFMRLKTERKKFFDPQRPYDGRDAYMKCNLLPIALSPLICFSCSQLFFTCVLNVFVLGTHPFPELSIHLELITIAILLTCNLNQRRNATHEKNIRKPLRFGTLGNLFNSGLQPCNGLRTLVRNNREGTRSNGQRQSETRTKAWHRERRFIIVSL